MNQVLDQQASAPSPTEHPVRPLGDELDVFPVALGTNTFGWTSSEDDAFAILDAYTYAGGNLIDTADAYPSMNHDGTKGNTSEQMIGRWLARNGKSPKLIIATKVALHPDFPGLSPDNIRAAADASRARLGVDAIDLYYAHRDDPNVPLVDTVATMSELVDEGKIRHIGISNYSPERVREWLEITEREGFHRPIAMQSHYNLMERGLEADLLPLAREAGLGVLPYWSLAHGFLTGKYRGGAAVESPRAPRASAYLTPRGEAVLSALTGIAGRLKVQPGSVALAWLLAQPGVAAPIASARNAEQVPLLLDAARISLDSSEIDELTRASTPKADPAPTV